MAAVLNVVFLGLSGVGFIPLIQQAIANAKPPQYVVSVGIGQGLNESDSLGGNVPGVSLWTARGEAIGGALGRKRVLDDASVYEASVSGNSSLGEGKAPAEYISVTAGGDDAICVAYVAVTEPTETKRVFMGDVGASCNFDFYYSILVVGGTRPRCVWIDKNHSNGLRFQGMGIHLPSFSNGDSTDQQGLAAQYGANLDTMCKSGPRLRMYEELNAEDPILFFSPPFTSDDFNEDGSDKDISKIIKNPGKFTDINLDLANKACASSEGCPHIIDQIDQNPNTKHKKRQTRNPWAPGQLVVSNHAEHSAIELCNSAYSRGPDFVSLQEMKYCDMDTKLTWDVCSSHADTCCLDIETQNMRPCGYGDQTSSRIAISMPNKGYNKVRRWGW